MFIVQAQSLGKLFYLSVSFWWIADIKRATKFKTVAAANTALLASAKFFPYAAHNAVMVKV